MTNVQNTLVSALPSGAQAAYPREFEAVVTALNEREYRLTDLIAGEVSRRLGVTEAQVKDQLAAAGMALRPAPVPVAVPDMTAFEVAMTEEVVVKKSKKGGKKGKKSEVAKLAKVVGKLVKAAERHGVSI
jgi:hypothetical protein